jgi:hypothetical protein
VRSLTVRSIIRGLWQDQPPIRLLFVNAEIPTGGVPFRPVRLWLPSLNYRSGNYDSRQTYVSSAELRSWCERNRKRVCIPEWLLDAWDIPVDPNLSDAA